MKLTKLKDHAAIKTVSGVARSYMAKCDPSDPSKGPPATKRESYAIEAFLAFSNVTTCMDQLYFSIDMLSGYRKSNAAEGMNRHEYIVFNIENYYLRITSVYDRCLRLANTLFQLGLPERECKDSTVTNNLYVKGTDVAKTLKELDKFTSQFRFHRNVVAHKSNYSENELDRIGTYFVLEEEDEEMGRYSSLYKLKADHYVKKKKTEFRDNIDQLERLVASFFDATYEPITTRLERYV